MTEKRFDVTALGEILIDFTEWGFSDAGTRLFAQNPGGAVANVAAAVALGPDVIDVSGSLESARGVKSIPLLRAFVATLNGLRKS